MLSAFHTTYESPSKNVISELKMEQPNAPINTYKLIGHLAHNPKIKNAQPTVWLTLLLTQIFIYFKKNTISQSKVTSILTDGSSVKFEFWPYWGGLIQ